MAEVPVRAQETPPPANRSGVIVKAGLDAPGTHEVEGGGGSGSTDVDGGAFLSGELYATVHPMLELGAGFELQFPRSQQDFIGDFGFIPIYGLARFYPIVGPVAPYVIGRLGMSVFYGDDDYKGSGELEAGGHFGLGAGLVVHRVQFEALYSVNTGLYTIAGTEFDVTYSKWGISVGYVF
jgi:hypothetical protein